MFCREFIGLRQWDNLGSRDYILPIYLILYCKLVLCQALCQPLKFYFSFQRHSILTWIFVIEDWAWLLNLDVLTTETIQDIKIFHCELFYCFAIFWMIKKINKCLVSVITVFVSWESYSWIGYQNLEKSRTITD